MFNSLTPVLRSFLHQVMGAEEPKMPPTGKGTYDNHIGRCRLRIDAPRSPEQAHGSLAHRWRVASTLRYGGSRRERSTINASPNAKAGPRDRFYAVRIFERSKIMTVRNPSRPSFKGEGQALRKEGSACASARRQAGKDFHNSTLPTSLSSTSG